MGGYGDFGRGGAWAAAGGGTGLGRGIGGAEVDLTLSGIDTGDADIEAIAEADDAAGMAAGELAAGGVEDVEIVVERGEGDDAAHGEVGDIDEEAEVPDIGDECGVGLGLAGVELAIEEGEEFDVTGVAFGVG